MIWRQVMVLDWPRLAPIPQRLDNGLEYSYRQFDRNAAVYYPPAIAQVVGWWQRNGGRWSLHRLGLWLGVLSIKEADYYRNAWWSWPWQGNHGPWARRYIRKHGLRAYRAAFPQVRPC